MFYLKENSIAKSVEYSHKLLYKDSGFGSQKEIFIRQDDRYMNRFGG